MLFPVALQIQGVLDHIGGLARDHEVKQSSKGLVLGPLRAVAQFSLSPSREHGAMTGVLEWASLCKRPIWCWCSLHRTGKEHKQSWCSARCALHSSALSPSPRRGAILSGAKNAGRDGQWASLGCTWSNGSRTSGIRRASIQKKGGLATTLGYDYLFGVGIGETGHARWLQGRGSRGNPSRVRKQGR